MKPDGRPAFPCHFAAGHEGMSLRDYFAAAALASCGYFCTEDGSAAEIAKVCYEIADAMIARRGQE